MKNSVLKLENYDTVSSIREKLALIGEGGVLISPPKRMRQKISPVGWRQLKYYARSLGLEIAILNPDKNLKKLAGFLNIAVFTSIEKAESADWEIRLDRSKVTSIHNRREEIISMKQEQKEKEFSDSLKRMMRSGLLFIGFMLLLALVIYFLPSASIIIYPVPHKQEVTLDITLTPEIESVNIAGFIPAVIMEKTLIGQRTSASSGSILVGESKARGYLVVKNLTTDPVAIPENTVFTTVGENPLEFSPLQFTSIPAGQASFFVEVEANDPGMEGNVGSGEITTTLNIKPGTIEISNPEAFSGGTSIDLPAPTQEDYERLRAELLSSIHQKALNEFETQLTDDYVLIPETLMLVGRTEELVNNPVGQASDTISLELTASYRILAYKPGQLSELVRNILDTSIADGYHKLNDSIQLNQSGTVIAPDGKTATKQITGTRIIVQNWDSEILKGLLIGKRIVEAKSILASEIIASEEAKFELFLDFWPILPWNTQRITIKEWVDVEG